MRFFSALLALVALPVGILADGASLTATINNVDAATIRYNNTVTAYVNAAGAQATVNQIKSLINVIKNNAASAQASGRLDAFEAWGLVGPVNTLVADVQTTLGNVVTKKALYRQAGLTATVRSNILAAQDAANDFSDIVISKVPSNLQSYARSLIDKLDPAFDNAAAQYA